MEVKGNFINYGDYVDVHDNEVVNLNVGNGKVEVNKQPTHFPPSLDFNQGQAALNFLKEKDFVPSETEPGNFLYQMGCTEESPDEVRPVVWLKNKQLLREMLEHWYSKLLEDESFTQTKMAAVCSQVFVNEDGDMIHLAKRKSVPSWESEKLKDFFATI